MIALIFSGIACGDGDQKPSTAPADAAAKAGGPAPAAHGTGRTYPEPTPNTPYDDLAELEMKGGSMSPGSERYLCQVFGNPFGRDVDLVTLENTSTYSHHHFVFMGEDFLEPGDPYPCQEVPPVMPFVLSAQGNHIVNNYPAGMGLRVVSNEGLMLQGHYVNTTDQMVTPSVRVRLYAANPGVVDTHVGIAFFMMGPGKGGVSPIPPGSSPSDPWTFEGQSCPLLGYGGSPVNILWSVGHMHASGLRVVAKNDSTTLYESMQWDDPITEISDPAITLGSGTSIWWTCDYKNDTSEPIMFGDGYNDAMCAMFFGYYPADPQLPTQLCQRPAGFDAVPK